MVVKFGVENNTLHTGDYDPVRPASACRVRSGRAVCGYVKCDNVQNRAIHLFLGVDKFSLLPTLQRDMPFHALQEGFILFQGRGGVKSRSKETVDNVGTIQLETLSPI